MENYQLSAWDLSILKPTKTTFLEIEKKTKALEAQRKKLTNSITPTNFLKILQNMEELRVQSSKLAIYANLRWSEDALNADAAAYMSKVETFLTKTGNRLLFFNLWFKDLPEKKAQELIKASGKYAYYFKTIRRQKKYALKENEEKIINIKDTSGLSALNNIYGIVSSQFEFEFQGKKHTQEEMITHVRSSKAYEREQAYNALLEPYQKNKALFGEIYKNIINSWREESIGLRGYKNPIQVRNVVNDIPDKAVEALLRVCERNEPLFHRFFELKRKKLGLKKLRRYDLYAPLQEEKINISYDQGVKIVLETFQEFSSEFYNTAKTIIDQGHVHSTVQKGKRSGAFCCGATTRHPPFVLLSYTGKYRDVSTLAHELGHGVHYSLARKQTEFTQEACLPLAETASIFSEMLLSEKMLKDQPEIAEAMLYTKLDDLYASIIRQAGFVRFEIKAHEMIKEGKTTDEIAKIYLTDLKKQLGPKIEVADTFAYEWTFIPHIYHTPFYCYAYAFGNLLTLALYEMYKQKGKSFVPKIIEMLEKGSCQDPVSITKAVGVDITSEKFWQQGFDVIKEMIQELEKKSEKN